METFSKILDQFLIEINESINDKISGINLLELLKFGLIEKFKDLDENVLKDLKLISLNKKILENEIDLNNRKITYKIEYFDKSVSKIKHKTEKDYLSLILEGLKKITIYENNNDKKSIYSNLSKNMGIVLSINTVITTKITGESIILSISKKFKLSKKITLELNLSLNILIYIFYSF